MIIRCIHGIHAKEGRHNMSRFAEHLALTCPGNSIQLFEYGFMGFWAARWRNDEVAQNLCKYISSGPEVWVTHSNGAAVAYLAVTKYGAKPEMIINFNPALDRLRTADVPAVETVHSNGDRAVYVSQFLPFHIWGDQGKVGYRGSAKNTINHSASNITGRMAYNDHCGAFDPIRIRDWAYFVPNRIFERLGK